MIYRFKIVSDEVENFKREIMIDSDATFYDFYKVLIDSLDYNAEEMASFFICSSKWRRMEEITLVEMDTESDEDSYVMDETPLDDFLEDEKQKLLFVFDYLNDRALYIELSEIITGETLDAPVCTESVGVAPVQTIEPDEDMSGVDLTVIDDSFLDTDSFMPDELDEIGFESLDDPTLDLSNEELI